MTKQEQMEKISKARRMVASISIHAFAMIYGADYLKFEPSSAHKEVYLTIDSTFVKRGRRIVKAAPRGFGKTTTVSTITAAYAVCFGKERFILICSNTAAQAQEKIEAIRKFLMENPLIKEDFPELFGSKNKMPIWTREEIVTATGIRIMAAGFLQRIRGLKHGASRPSLVIMDDLDSESHSRNYEQKDKVKDWFLGTLLKIGDENTNYILIGNIFHRFSVIGDLCSDKDHHDWEKYIYRALITFPKQMDLWARCWRIYIKSEEFEGARGTNAAKCFYEKNAAVLNEDAVLLWPERYKLFDLMIEYFRDPATFFAELQNQPREAVNDDFDPQKFHYWDKTFLNRQALIGHIGGENGVYYAACDPSTGKGGVQGDNSAIIIAGVKDKVTYILHESIRRRSINELIEDILAYCRMYKFRTFGIEVNGGQEYFYQTLTEKASVAGISCNFKKILNTGDKISRISALAPDLRVGTIQLSRDLFGIIDEATDFPHCRHDDGLDALQMVFELTKDNGFMFWWGGSKFDPPPDAFGGNGALLPKYPTPDGLVPYGFYHGRR